MTTLRNPFYTSEQPGIERLDLKTTTIAASPATVNFTLTRQGIWLGTFSAWSGSQNSRGAVVVILKWYQYSSGWVLGADLLGTVSAVGNVSDLAVSPPTSAGVVATTVTFSGGGSPEVRGALNLRLLSSPENQWII